MQANLHLEDLFGGLLLDTDALVHVSLQGPSPETLVRNYSRDWYEFVPSLVFLLFEEAFFVVHVFRRFGQLLMCIPVEVKAGEVLLMARGLE